MKTAKQWVQEWGKDIETPFEDIIEQAQQEAYNKALKDVVKEAKILITNNDGYITNSSSVYVLESGTFLEIDPDSIFNLKK